MKHTIPLIVLLLSLLLLTLGFLGNASTNQSLQTGAIYTPSALQQLIAADPHHWVNRTVRVRGVYVGYPSFELPSGEIRFGLVDSDTAAANDDLSHALPAYPSDPPAENMLSTFVSWFRDRGKQSQSLTQDQRLHQWPGKLLVYQAHLVIQNPCVIESLYHSCVMANIYSPTNG